MLPILLGLGSNFGACIQNLTLGLRRLGETAEVQATSSVYRSAPVGCRDQPDFLNVVWAGHTELAPDALLAETRAIEQSLGRVRSFPNAPRTIDIDILAYGDVALDTPELTLPHPRLHQRAFVLVPLAEIAPEWRHPIFGKTAAELLAEAGPVERLERIGRLPGW